MITANAVFEGVGEVETQFFTFAQDQPFPLHSGERLGPITLAYETYGVLNPARDNAVLVFHALSGSQHAAGDNFQIPQVGALWTGECRLGWWDAFIGPGRAIDTGRFFVLCVNYLGGCYGSTGPASRCPATGKPYGASFPRLTLADMVDTQMRLLDHLKIDKLHAVIGASLGGMMCLSLATRYPERVSRVIPIASGLEATPLHRLHNFEQIYAIESDPDFCGGDYYDGPHPECGLALARMISHKTFVSLHTMEERARLEISRREEPFFWYPITSPLESYMLHQGKKFVRRFDANTYLRIVDAWQRFSLTGEAGVAHLDELFTRCRNQQYLIFSIDSDVCFFPEEQEEIVRLLKENGVRNLRITVHSEKGHDAFLAEPEFFSPYMSHFLNNQSSH